MKLPNASHAEIPIEKLRDYCLNFDHRKGAHKARVFRAALNLTVNDAAHLSDILLSSILDAEVVAVRPMEFGTLYSVDVEVAHAGQSARVRTGWLIKSGESVPRLVSCYVKQEVAR